MGLRVTARVLGIIAVLPAALLLVIPTPNRSGLQRGYCRLVLCCLGVRITVSGNPIRNLRGVLVVSDHVSWLDVFVIGAVLPGSFVAKAELFCSPALDVVRRLMSVIAIERASLRRLPAVIATVSERLRAGRTVVAFPEGTTWCGRDNGSFRPAMFQAAVDAGRPVQPLRLRYRHSDGALSTVPAYIGEDSLLSSLRRIIVAARTHVDVTVEGLQLPGASRKDLAKRCQTVVRAPEAATANAEGRVSAG